MTTPKDKDIESAKKLLEPGVVRFSWKAHVDEIAQALAAAREEGREQAAKHIDSKITDYVEEFGSYDQSTGQTEFSDAGEQYLETLEELAEEIRNLPTNTPEGESDE